MDQNPTSTPPQPPKPNPEFVKASQNANQTSLAPLEEQLFKSWISANGFGRHDELPPNVDLRGVYRQVNGMVQPPGSLQKSIDRATVATTDPLMDTMMKRQGF